MPILLTRHRGMRDESEPIIRLADAMAGFVRDLIEGQPYAAEWYEKAVANGMLRELLRKSSRPGASF